MCEIALLSLISGLYFSISALLLFGAHIMNTELSKALLLGVLPPPFFFVFQTQSPRTCTHTLKDFFCVVRKNHRVPLCQPTFKKSCITKFRAGIGRLCVLSHLLCVLSKLWHASGVSHLPSFACFSCSLVLKTALFINWVVKNKKIIIWLPVATQKQRVVLFLQREVISAPWTALYSHQPCFSFNLLRTKSLP